MNWNLRKNIFFICLLFAFSASAQLQEMTLDQAVEMALKNNYNIQIAKNNVEAAKNLARPSQAGFLPLLQLNGGANYSNNNTNIEFAGGALPPVERNGVENTSLNGGLTLNYVLFNGFGRTYTYRNLMAAQSLTEVQAQVLAENLAMDVINRFLNIQQMQLDLLAAQENLNVSRERMRRVKTGLENGVKTGLDVLLAEVDLARDSLLVEQWIVEIEKEKGSLNVFMGRDPAIPFFVSRDQPVPAAKSQEEWRKLAMSSNTTLQLSGLMLQMAGHQEQITASGRMPQLMLNSGYGLQSSQNGAGIIVSQRTLGFNAGLQFGMPVFNGFQLKRAMENARLNTQSREWELEQSVLLIEQQLFHAQLDEILLKSNISTLYRSLDLSEKALKRAQEAYEMGQITSADFRAAQSNVLQAKSALYQAETNLVRLYFQLTRMGGELLK